MIDGFAAWAAFARVFFINNGRFGCRRGVGGSMSYFFSGMSHFLPNSSMLLLHCFCLALDK